jgi:hypothetical protein
MTLLDDALALVNAARKACDQRPLPVMPLGVPGDGRFCPVATALRPCGVRVATQADVLMASEKKAYRIAEAWGTRMREVSAMNWEVELPDPLAHFVVEFDSDRWPEMQLSRRDED